MVEQPSAIGGYEILRRLDDGGEGGLYAARARDRHGVPRVVALRLFRADQIAEGAPLPGVLERLRVSAPRPHPSLVHLFDLGVDGDQPFLVMEYVEGICLEALAAALPGPLPPELVAFVGREVCSALEALHRGPRGRGTSFGLVHGGVSARRILVSRTGEVKLGGVERGTGRVSADLSEDGHADVRTDLYALGQSLLPLVPKGSPLDAVLSRATSDDPDHGFQSARALRLALDVASRSGISSAPARDRRRRDEVQQAQLAGLFALAEELADDGDDRFAALGPQPMDRFGFTPRHGMLLGAVDPEPTSSEPEPEPAPRRRGRRTREIEPSPFIEVHPEPEVLDFSSDWDHGDAGDGTSDDSAPPLGVGEDASLGDEAAFEPNPPEVAAIALPAPPAFPDRSTDQREAEWALSSALATPLVSHPAFRLLVVATAVLLALLVSLGFLLVDRGRREAEAARTAPAAGVSADLPSAEADQGEAVAPQGDPGL